MGILQHEASEQSVRLNGHTVVGRAPSTSLCIDEKAISKQHAEIWWADGAWRVRDLDSRNGTWIDGTRLAIGEVVQLRKGTRLGFGRPENAWTLTNDEGPVPIGVRVSDDEVAEGRPGLLALPSESEPVVVVYQNDQGWFIERENESAAVPPEQVIEVQGETWRLELPLDLPGTADIGGESGPTIADIALEFEVTPNEEIVHATWVHRDRRRQLPPRSFQYMLLTLARERLEDARNGMDAQAQGWVDTAVLAQQLRVAVGLLNVWVHRSRIQLANEGVANAAELVQRHGRSGQMRIGVPDLTVRVQSPD